jgi:hypothetical protein
MILRGMIMRLYDEYSVVANTREEFSNLSSVSTDIYNDHPSQKSIH